MGASDRRLRRRRHRGVGVKIGKVLVTADEIAAKIADMGEAITNDYRGKDLLMVGILKGAFVIMADLSRRVDLPLEFDFMAVSSYGASTKTSGVVRILKDLDDEIEGRDVLIVEDIIDFLEIQPFRKSFVGMLPYGVQKRVELGRALAMEPHLLLLDEPVAGMNLEETEDMARFILDVRNELGVAIILVEHDMRMVMDLADRVLVVDFGKPVALGPPEDIQSNPDVIKAYLGQEHHVVGEGEIQ